MKKFTLLWSFILLFGFISFNSNAQTSGIDAYKMEAEGYFANPVQTPYGIVITDNMASKLYLLNNGKLEVLVEAPGCGRYFTVSPDKKRIGFKLINEQGLQSPAVFDLSEKSVEILHKPVKLCGQVSFSKDGKTAFTVGEQLYIQQNRKTTVYDLGYYANIAPVSPDGKSAVFNNQDDQLLVINLDNGSIRQITDNRSGYVYPKWSPDGEKLAYSTLASDIYVKHGSEKAFIGKGENFNWSDDSQFLIFNRVNREKMQFHGSDIFVAKFDGSKIQNLTNTPDIHEMSATFTQTNEIVYHTYNKKEIVTSRFEVTNQKLTQENVVFSHNGSLQVSARQSNKEAAKTRANVYISDVPYVNQVYDTPDWHNGYGSCAPSTAAMAFAYYNILPKWPITVTKHHTHTSDYGAYVADKYRYNERYYDDYKSSRNAWGGYGYMWTDGSPSSKMRPYIQYHNLESVQDWTCAWSTTINEIDNGFPHPICSMLSSSGHLTLAVGYIQGQHTITFHDPYGDKNYSSWPNYEGWDSEYDWPGYNNGYANLNQVAWTVTARGTEISYNDTIIDDLYFNHGFHIQNASPSHMKYFRDQNAGYNNHSWWTMSTASGDDVAWTKWTPNLSESGEYKVYAYIPSTYANAQNCVYKVYHDGGTSWIAINQADYNDEWAYLGTYNFTASSDQMYVYLGDVTGVSGEYIAFDAVKFSAVNATQTTLTTQVNMDGNYADDFTVTFTDDASEGVQARFYMVSDYNGNEWRANGQNGFFNDNFENGLNAEWTADEGTWTVQSGKLHQTDEAVYNSNIYTSLTQDANSIWLYQWKTSMTGTPGNRRSGIHFFADDATSDCRGNSYFVYFRIAQNKAQIYKVENDQYYLKTDDDCVLDADVEYDFKIMYNPANGLIEAYVDDQLVSSWTDSSPYTSGQYLSLRTGSCVATYDDIRVYKSRNTSEIVTVGSEATNDVRYESPSQGEDAVMVYSLLLDNQSHWSEMATASAEITFDNPQIAPVAADDNAVACFETEATLDILANDTDEDGTIAPATVVVVSDVSHGSTWVNPTTGLIAYYPADGYNGSDSFTYTVKDNEGNTSNTATVTISVSPPAIPDFTASETAVLEGASVTFTNSSTGASSYSWTFTSGTPESSTNANPVITYSTAGTYGVTLTAYDDCANAYSLTKIDYIDVFAEIDIQIPEICVVGVDDATNKNVVYWEKETTNQIDYYKIYKETNESGVFSEIGTVSYADAGTYTDSNSNPDERAARYKISAVDVLGGETVTSTVHKTIHLTINAGMSGAWNLIWDNYEGFDYLSYNIYRGSSSSDLALLTQVSNGMTSFTDLNPPTGAYYCIEVVNPNGCGTAKKSGATLATSRSNIVKTTLTSMINPEKNGLDIYPNPAKEMVYVNYAGEINRNATLQIINMQGQIMKQYQLVDNQTQVDISFLPKGVYLFKVRSNEQFSVKRMVKE